MYCIKKITTAAAAALLATNLSQALAFTLSDVYVGGKVAKRHMGFKRNYGNSFFDKSLNQYGVFAGMDLFENFGIEAEYFTTSKKKSSPIVYDNQTEFGIPDWSGASNVNFDSRYKIYGAGVQFKAYYPIVSNLKIFGSLGLSCFNIKINAIPTATNPAALTPAQVPTYTVATKTSTKVVPKFTVGLDWRIMKNLGIKAEAAIENTNIKFDFIQNSRKSTLKPNKSLIYGLSVYLAM